MAIWARVQDGIVAETTGADPAGRYHPSLAWQSAPEGVEAGMSYAEGAYHRAAELPGPPAPHPVPWSALRMRLAAAGLWTAFAHALDGLPPEQRWRLLTLEHGVAADDAVVLALFASIGADPAAMLA